MKILFAGDSISNGKLGASFTDLISQNSFYQTTNLGRDGETFNLIFKRLVGHLNLENDYDYIVLQGGYNDILLPSFLKKRRIFKWTYDYQIKHGHSPIPVTELESFLMREIQKVRELYKGPIIFLTIGCIGEQLNSDLNLQRNKFNEVIKHVTQQQNLYLVNPQIEFDKYLNQKQQSNYCLENFWAIAIWDRLTKNLNKLSHRRNLHLTIDGVHLNDQGAEIFANCVIHELKNLS